MRVAVLSGLSLYEYKINVNVMYNSVRVCICYSLIKPLLTTILPENELSGVPC